MVARSLTTLGLAFAFSCPSLALAQAYPSKPIKVISTIPIGASGDIALRLVTAKLSQELAQPFVVEVVAAAGGVVAGRTVAKAAPDGYTFLHQSSNFASSPFIVKDLGFSPLKDFTPVTTISSSPVYIAVNGSLPINSVQDLVAYAKKNPGKLSYASNGVGSYFHIIGETFMATAGINVLHIPYTGGNSAIPLNDLLTGRVDVYWPTVSQVIPHLGTGKVKLLTTFGQKRMPQTPEVPTIAEVFPAYSPFPSWFGFIAPGGLPQPIALRIHGEIVKALGDSTVTTRFTELGLVPGGESPLATATLVANTYEIAAKAVKQLGIEPQ